MGEVFIRIERSLDLLEKILPSSLAKLSTKPTEELRRRIDRSLEMRTVRQLADQDGVHPKVMELAKRIDSLSDTIQ